MTEEFWKSLPLLATRALRGSDSRLASHIATRHQDKRDGFYYKDGRKFNNRAVLFPPHMTQGDISKVKKIVEHEYALNRQGKPSSVVNVEEAELGKRVTTIIDVFGVHIVTAYIVMGIIQSVYPMEATGGTYLKLNGKKVKKASLRSKAKNSLKMLSPN